MRKGLSRISEMVLGLFIGFSVLAGVVTVNGGIAEQYSRNIDQENLDNLEGQRNISDQLNVGKERARDVGGGIESGFFALTQVWNAIKVTFMSIPILNTFVHQFVVILGLPGWFEALFNGLGVATIVFGIIWLYRGVMP